MARAPRGIGPLLRREPSSRSKDKWLRPVRMRRRRDAVANARGRQASGENTTVVPASRSMHRNDIGVAALRNYIGYCRLVKRSQPDISRSQKQRETSITIEQQELCRIGSEPSQRVGVIFEAD